MLRAIKFIVGNETFEEIMGYNREKLLGMDGEGEMGVYGGCIK